MTTVEQIALANEKVTRWRGKCEHAASMLSKWESRLKGLQSKGKPEPTAKKLPPLTLVPASNLDKELKQLVEKEKVVPISKGEAKPKKPPTFAT